MRARVIWIAALASLRVAHADPAADALTHLDRGVAAYRAGDYARAHAELVQASTLAPDRPNPYRWLAMTEVELGDCDNARIHVESFLSRVPVGDPRVPEVISLRERCAPPRPAPVLTTTAPASASPLWHRWWFWTAIGAVAITTAGVTYAATRDSTTTLPPVTCGATGCR